METAMREAGERTKYPGVYRLGDNRYRVTGKVRDPRTGRVKFLERVVTADTENGAVRARLNMIEEVREGRNDAPPSRLSLRDCVTRWLVMKGPTLDERTLGVYTYRLGLMTARLGDIYADALRIDDIQGWANKALGDKYSVHSIRGSLRVFRSMVRDLGLPDPSGRVSLPDAPPPKENRVTAEQAAAFLAAMKEHERQHYALVAIMLMTGLRHTHASALKWEDVDEGAGVVRIRRKNVLRREGEVSRKKAAPTEIPLVPELQRILREQRELLFVEQHPGLALGLVFPGLDKDGKGAMRWSPTCMLKAWNRCKKLAGITGRFTPHGLRRTFNDLTRRAGMDGLVIRAMTAHSTDEMRRDYSTVGLDEKARAVRAVAGVLGRTEGRTDEA